MQEPAVTPAQLRAGRALLDLSQAELAERAGLTVEVIAEAETKREADLLEPAAVALQAVLEGQGVLFLDADGGQGPGVRLKSSGPPDEGLRPDQLTSDNDI